MIKKLADCEINKISVIDPFNNPLDSGIINFLYWIIDLNNIFEIIIKLENENNKKNKNSKLFIKEIPLNEYKNISIKDDFDELCKLFGKSFPDEKIKEENKVQEKKEADNYNYLKNIEGQNINDNFGESIDLRFDKYVKLRDYKNSLETVIYI